MQTRAALRSGPEGGLFELVLAGAAAAARSGGGSVGIIELASLPADEGPNLVVEAEFAYREGTRVLGSLELRARAGGEICRFDTADTAFLRATLARFGGLRVTNLSAGRAGGELADVTVSFGSRFPYLATNVGLFAEGLPPADTPRLAEILAAFGVSSKEEGGTLVTPRRQLRATMSVEQQMAAYRAARSAGYDASLYTARVPCTQAARFAETGPLDAPSLDLVLSRGLTPSYTCTSVDAGEMEALISTHLRARFTDREWTLTHSVGGGDAEQGPQLERGLKWFQKNPRRRR